MTVANPHLADPCLLPAPLHSSQHVGPLYPLLSNLQTNKLVDIVPILCPKPPSCLPGSPCDTDFITFFFLTEENIPCGLAHSILLISGMTKPPGFWDSSSWCSVLSLRDPITDCIAFPQISPCQRYLPDFISHLTDSYSLILFYHLFLLIFFFKILITTITLFHIYLCSASPQGDAVREDSISDLLLFDVCFKQCPQWTGYLMLVDFANCRFNLQMFNRQKWPNVL